MEQKSLTVLLGSGISIHAGMPKVGELTNIIMEGGYWKATNGRFCKLPRNEIIYPKLTNHITNLIRILTKFFDHQSVNYEEIYQVLAELDDDENGEYSFAGAKQYRKMIEQELSFDQISIIELIKEARNYIKDIIQIELSKELSRPIKLGFFIELINDPQFKTINFITLNHDLLFETWLSENNFDFDTGFLKNPEGLNVWNRDNLINSGKRIHFLKLHGSIDWLKYKIPGNLIDGICIPEIRELELEKPEFLIGTNHKILNYSQYFFYELFEIANSYFRSADKVLVCGYGFGDKVINSLLIQWIEREISPIKVIEPYPDKFGISQNARYAIRKNWGRWKKLNRLHLLENKIEDISYGGFEW